jgi:hypothetical protein
MGEVRTGLVCLIGEDGRRGEECLVAEKARGEVWGLRGLEWRVSSNLRLYLSAEAALSMTSKLGRTGGWVDLMNSANSEYESMASPSVSMRLTIASNSVSLA